MRAIMFALYAQLPNNGSELVLFDLNRSVKFGLLLRPDADTALARLLPDPPRRFRATVIANGGPDTREFVERVTEAGATTTEVRAGALVPARGVLALPHRPAVSDERRPIRNGSGSGRGLRREPGGARRAGRAGHADRESGPACPPPILSTCSSESEGGMGAAPGRAAQAPAR